MLRLAFAALALPLLTGAVVLADERRAIADARRDASEASARAQRLEREAERARDAAVRTRAQAVAVAARVEAAEARLAGAEARLRFVAALQRAQRARLAEKQAATVRLVAALQTLARRPLAAMLAQPGSTAELVRVRATMAAVLPTVRERTAGLRGDLARSRQLRAAALSARGALRAEQARLEDERMVLVRLEAVQRAQSRTLASGALFERDRATALGEEARDVGELVRVLERQAVLAERLAGLDGPVLRPGTPGSGPSQGAARARRPNPPYRLPVRGEVLAGLGERAESGQRSRGVTVSAAPHAIVVAPSNGRVAFAAPYRGFGRIVILDHGGGWTTLITGLEGLDVEVGEQVDQGSPLGRTGARRSAVTVELRRQGQPVDILALAG